MKKKIIPTIVAGLLLLVPEPATKLAAVAILIFVWTGKKP